MQTHKLAGQKVILNSVDQNMDGQEFTLEDWWMNVHGSSWMTADGNPACLQYAIRAGFQRFPMDDNVVYGKIGGLGYLVHESELPS